jgi:Fe-S cluster assembly protein SufD
MNDMVANPSALALCFEKSKAFAGDKKWLEDFRAQQFKQFIQRGLPTKKEEAWKYTEIKQSLIPAELGSINEWLSPKKLAEIKKIAEVIFTFINGQFVEDLSFQTGEIASSISQMLEKNPERLKPYLTQEMDGQRFPFAKLNSALFRDGVFVDIPKKSKIHKPIYLLFINTQQNQFLTNSRNIIVANENSEVTIIEEHLGQTAQHYFTNVVTDIKAAANAAVTYYKLQAEDETATHTANIFVEQQQNSRVKTYFLSCGARLARDDLSIWQHASGTETEMYGLYTLQHDQQHIDHHLHVDHLAAHGTSSMLYKGVMAKKSRAVFNGKVHVHPEAQQINAHQFNHNLLLSADAEIYTKPELEIYADDVKCTHGATVGQLDNESLFYLRSRGIDLTEAHALLRRAFAEEIYSKIEDANIAQYLQKRMHSHDE